MDNKTTINIQGDHNKIIIPKNTPKEEELSKNPFSPVKKIAQIYKRIRSFF